ncbi:PmbA protein [Alkalihalobacillus xiaoxiensis]|uniref:PmbA protein n=1 Tax=Shouchella xiaoxiensis TaxID=766895 RepID=A0ABS2SSY0_9BACI|nr:TldD/PmbA family protein [Shouchella xiaoxiensis]MBM7837387.1 PmbA protein [Shouchella xiaoxiensis]
MKLIEFKNKLFEEGKQAGFSEMEVYYQSTESFSANIFQGEVDGYTLANEGGLSFRGLINGVLGYAYTEKIDATQIHFLISEATENAMLRDADKPEQLFAGSAHYEEVAFYSETLNNVSAEAKIKLLKETEAYALSQSDQVTSVNHCGLLSKTVETYLANTTGLDKSEKRNITYVVLSVVVASGEDFKSAMKFWITDDFSTFQPKQMAQETVEEALSYIGATSIKSKHYPILLRNTAAASLLHVYASGFSADNVQNGRSLLKGQLEKRIASSSLTLIDNPHMNAGLSSQTFDHEGVATQPLHVIKNGTLKSYLYNQQTAEKDGVQSTGHGFKTSYKDTVSVAPSNMYIQPSDTTLDSMVASLDEGIMVTSLQGLHSGADSVSGDFSLAANGYYIKDGKIDRPVDQITIAGNFFELLQQVEAIGDDLQFSPVGHSFIGSPSLQVPALSVGGI